MNFNYRDFFIHNDDSHIIKEQLSIVDEMGVSKKDDLKTNAKTVWDMYQTENNEQKIADTLNINLSTVQKIANKLNINLSTVQKIVMICLMKQNNDEITRQQIANAIDIQFNMVNGISLSTIRHVLLKTLGSDWKRKLDVNVVSNAVKIYDYYKNGKTPDEIVGLVNKEKKEHGSQKITVDNVNLVLKIVDIAEKQMQQSSKNVNASYIHREIGKIGEKITLNTTINIIKKLNLGEIKYKHKFTEKQDAFILFNYLQGIGPRASARSFNDEFKTDLNGNPLNIVHNTITYRLINSILKSNSESKISEYALKLLSIYKKEYFSTVNIEDPETKNLLTHYIPPETVGGRDRTGTGTNRDMSAHLGTVQTNFNTMLPPYYKS